jgi:hypothetical protein
VVICCTTNTYHQLTHFFTMYPLTVSNLQAIPAHLSAVIIF